MIRPKYILLALATFISSTLHAQRNSTYQEYIDTYSDMAVEQMRQHKIPASITMAQALLESGAGRSYLATNANNHFGIKVSGGWTGPYVRRDDDRKNEKFRKYRNVKESYEDHSLFLKQPRYSRLFSLRQDDYKAWARGLKACGYATLPTYADRLITIIETYELHQLDKGKYSKYKPKQNKEPEIIPHGIITVNGLRCLVARPGDTWESLAKETKVSRRSLVRYNETSKDVAPEPGMNIFLEKKAKKAAKEYKGYWHKIKSGESLYSISQLYGIRIESLYKMNYKDDSYVPVVGDLLKVR